MYAEIAAKAAERMSRPAIGRKTTEIVQQDERTTIIYERSLSLSGLELALIGAVGLGGLLLMNYQQQGQGLPFVGEPGSILNFLGKGPMGGSADLLGGLIGL